MKYHDAVSFRRALEQRLKDRASGDGARLVRDRKRVVFDRLLARLIATAPDRWVLKGGFSIDLRLAGRARTTKDVDLEWRDSGEELLDTLLDAAEHDPGDYFAFSVERATIPPDRMGGSQRFQISTSLAGRAFENFPLDVGFRVEEIAGIDMLTTPDLLAFAGLAPVKVPALPLELQIAEKMHAYTRVYEGGRVSTRIKDLIDIVLIAELLPLRAATLMAATRSTFAGRGTHPVPSTVPEPPGEWRIPFAQLAATLGISTDLAAAHAVTIDLLDPILDGTVRDGAWDYESRRWSTG